RKVMDHKLNIEDLQESLQTSFICKKHDSSEKYRSKFLINSGQFSAGNIQKVICDILDELRGCESFDISVAFITDGGVNLLTQTLLELKEKGIKGRILTTDYNLFSEPSALKELAKFENIDVRMYRCKEGSGFHVKSFIFNHSSQCNVIIGSSNLTQNALTTNQEWNVKFVSTFEGEMVFLIKKEFEKLWNDPLSSPLEEVIEEYEQERKTLKDLQRKAKAYISSLPQKVELKPNKMQESFIKKLDEIYHSGQNRALLISATGTGKTYAAAFSVKHLMEQKRPEHHKRPIKKVLFVVHREQIAIQAKNSFARVIGSEHGQTYGLLSGNHKDKECTFLFSTIQTLSLDRILKDFAPDAFDFIIIDEAHRSGANSYDKIMAHFQPEFWLGMTATPERTDDKDVFKIFNHQIAYEIRLKDALDYNLLCPFHYHGISDLKINNEEQKDFSNFAYLTSDERVKHVLQKAEEFKFSGERVKGLIFCSSVDEAKVLSEKLNQHNLRTTYLTGDSKPEARLAAVDRLAGADGPQALDYILTVDIFNEGVDIPEINQVIFLRPTQSPIIFTQQLGRGLRKAAGKEYVVILDFIANYEKNYLIPVALSGDNSYDKDSMRKLVMLGTKVIPGASTVEFEKVVRDRVLESIDNARTNTVELLRTSYQAIKNKLGRIPNLVDFYPHNGIDAVKFFEKKWAHYGSSYYGFLAKYEKDYTGKLSPLQAKMLSYLSGRFGNGKRVAEALLIESIINNKNTNADFFKEQLLKRFGIDASDDLLKNIVLNLSNQFNLTGDQKGRNKDVVFVEPIGTEDFRIADAFNRALNDETSSDFIVQLNDLIAFIYQRYDLRYSKRYRCMDLTLNEKYSYEDIPRLLNWSKYISAQIIGGYRYDDETNTLPVLVNYNKEDDAIAYEDHFENEEYLIALSKTNRKVDSKDAEIIFRKQPEYKNTKILLFVRKNKNDSETKTFYFLGEMNAAGDPEPVAVPKRDGTGGKVSAFKVRYRLESNVRRDIYEYITES
ncbi:DUF3427 domain-containing protein, partial [Parasutterella excrementihominis]|uniref:DUF3427 domain-containing protein n=5 Tax=Parasutterella TaxID=577310 RepID=UPI00242C50D7